MAFILIARSTGDDLIAAKDTVVAWSPDRKALEDLRDKRLKARTDWLSQNQLPWWAVECVIASERIEEIPTVQAAREGEKE